MTNTTQLFFEAELRAERLLGWVRLGIALALLSLFVVAVLRDPPLEDPILQRQLFLALLTLSAYLLVGLLSLAAARPGIFKAWHTWSLSTCDAAFLLLSLHIGLLNTAAAGNYMIALPAVWLIPLVLAFGALRFNPLQQAYVTILLGFGLLAIAVWTTSWVDASEPNFPATMNRLFQAPPNVMRLGMVLLAGIILTVAVSRTRRLLSQAIEENRRRIHLTRYLPPELVEELSDKGTEELRRGQRREVAVLFVDIRGFTRRSQGLAPAALSDFVTRFRSCVTDATSAHAGIVDKFIGDAALVVFGLNDNGENHAGNAMACARRLHANIESWNAAAGSDSEAVRIGIGIHWGEVFCGAVGDDSRLEFTVLGDAVNVAARIEELTKSVPSWLIVSGELLAAVEESDRQDWQAIKENSLRGRDKPIELFIPV